MASLKIGARIRKLRLDQHRTQQEIASAAGFTKSLLSKIESGHVVPPVATLVKIADALGTDISTLISSGRHLCAAMDNHSEATANLVQTERGYWIFPFASRYHGKAIQPMLIVARKGEVQEHHLTHRGEEFIYMLEGQMWVEVGDLRHRLGPGDSIYFNSCETHGIEPISQEAKYLNVFI